MTTAMALDMMEDFDFIAGIMGRFEDGKAYLDVIVRSRADATGLPVVLDTRDEIGVVTTVCIVAKGEVNITRK